MLTISTIAPSGTNAATRAAKMPNPMVSLTGVPVRGFIRPRFRHQPVPGHREEDPGLAVQDDEQHAGDRHQGAKRRE